jgi:autotransporter translocation and assembly factor TamB
MAPGNKWNVNALQIRLGDNSIEGKGSLQQKLVGQIDINCRVWPALAATCAARSTAGSISPVRCKAPQGKARAARQSTGVSGRIACKASTWTPPSTAHSGRPST